MFKNTGQKQKSDNCGRKEKSTIRHPQFKVQVNINAAPRKIKYITNK